MEMLSYVGFWLKIKENKEIKVKRNIEPNFQHYGKKIEVQAKQWFSYKKKCILLFQGKEACGMNQLKVANYAPILSVLLLFALIYF